ncbi:hypothetical protein [Barnesiella sp. An55]|uniref:hypothetical protein n=1 Tax=Barnesiella sp. An55 TaxID=1965646 RepID=UPI000B38B4EC|nr:hypothetical protein [Barnesiella sp. An55]OUN73041.1 hypothetical protein B5G10_06130 [Barnesiella sp. An55]HIZ26101.1 hypothetical protein [Candidatus Barnesiella merdipullorum]
MRKILILTLLGVGLAMGPLWSQSSGIMPRKSATVRIPVQCLTGPSGETVATPVEREPVVTTDSVEAVRPAFSPTAVDMLAFDKRMSDTRESFLLRNNSPYHLSRVVLKLVYRAPDGQMIDYRTCTVECDLLPGSTRKCEIDSFDRSRNYYHVDSPPARVSGRPFKVSYQVLRYDVVVEP